MVTTGKYHATRVRAIRETWGKGIEESVFFFTDEKGESPQFIPLEVPSDYQSASIKAVLALILSWERLGGPSLDWVMVCDDDTFIYVDALRDFLKDKNPDESVCYCQEIYHFPDLPKLHYPSGGAGFLLSRKALSQLSVPLRTCKLYPFSDVTVGVCMAEQGIRLVNTPGIYSQPPEIANQELVHQGKEGIVERPITFHYIPPERMYELQKQVPTFR